MVAQQELGRMHYQDTAHSVLPADPALPPTCTIPQGSTAKGAVSPAVTEELPSPQTPLGYGRAQDFGRYQSHNGSAAH